MTRRVLVAPVTVTPTKPLTPSHIKGLLWTDVLVRATEALAEVTYRYSHTTYSATEQTLGFWEHVDRVHGDRSYAEAEETEIGSWYVDYQAAGPAPAAALRPYAEAVEREGWAHPVTERVLQLWTGHYAALGLRDPGLRRCQPPGLGLEEALDRLKKLNLCLDLRPDGGPVYLDATRHGMPLRQITGVDGRPNYLACALRELLPLAPAHDEVVLICDRELEGDYTLLAKVLSETGPPVRRVVLGRVPLDGRVRSARHGDWRGRTAADLLASRADRDPDALRLGMRLYFIAVLGRGQTASFRPEVLDNALDRAERLLAGGPDPELDVAGYLAGHRRDHLHVDPYRLTSGLLSRHRPAPRRSVIEAVYT